MCDFFDDNIYDEFFESSTWRKYRKFKDCPKMRDVYDFLVLPENVNAMIEACKRGRPALEGVVQDMEKTFSFGERFFKQAVGAMVKHILSFFGYEATKQKTIYGTNEFKSATHYSFTEGTASQVLEVCVSFKKKNIGGN